MKYFDKVIMVDDEPMINKMHEIYLRKSEVSKETIAFTDPIEAKDSIPDMLTEGKNHLILIDIFMPNMTGFE